MIEKVLITTWGNPFQWEPISYEFKYDSGYYSLESSSTLPVLVEAIKPEKVILFVLDTLANIQIKGKPDVEPKEFLSYSEVVEDVRKRIKWFLYELSEKCPNLKHMLESGHLKIAVAPGIGLFKNIRVEGDVLDFYNYVIYELSRELPAGSAEIYLDLTHGINFMPTLVYRALNNLLGLSAFINDCKFVVLNSEPYPQGFSKEEKEKIISETKIRIRVVEDRVVQPKPIYSRVRDLRFSAFISSLANGLPLVFTTFYPKLDELRELIDKELRIFFENIEISNGSVKRKVAFSDDFKTLTKLYYLVRCLNSNELFKSLPADEVSVDMLEKIIETVFKKIVRLEIMTKRDVRQILDTVNKASKKEGEIGDRIRNGEKLLYLDVYNFAKDKNLQREKKVDPRNFLAHAGLISDRIYVRLEGGNIKLSYGDPDEIAEISVKSMWGKF
uniref:TIGR01897 family CRISPR-associated protein n=1 Tax=Geoglobus ahangari TaxID=113653 RepID=A0A7J3TGQ8_9EURY